ncbi:ABC transporter ATP-binding protein [Desertibacillus haloalkaliphilus]|uniref:ABC transporter ATP-binding protein n=1 Tax=Desertibacillus haloalkaliphilus TaxID=1328930 RepID=UPI001C269111|nr:ABC transporter ATP-binding protein [Desertibacillus haloalkaliphilus]MBU8908331.1 ABC transporter ATP-binding protein [Desertibacillus haloalkaliphilus]
MISIKGLSYHYKKKQILNHVDLKIESGELCALVGRNGAGKSTLIHAMLGLLQVKEGQVYLAGYSHKKGDWKKHVAYLPEKFQLHPQLTGEENMHFFASLADQKVDEERLCDQLKLVNLYEERGKPVKDYSKGMLQRLGLAVMLYYDTELLILDEPTSGLDPMGRAEVLQILKSLKGKTIFLSSHHMDEIRQVCSHVAYLEDGVMTKYTIDEFSKSVLEGENDEKTSNLVHFTTIANGRSL